MDDLTLRKTLSDIPLGGLRTFEKTGSTNDIALAWAGEGAPDLSLVYAEEQESGRGRSDRRWYSPPGCGLAFSLVLRPSPVEVGKIPRFSGLGALAVCSALGSLGLNSEIKWPNDVLLNRRKVCGVLVETVWLGDKADAIILGVGVNVTSGSVPSGERLNFPATCVESELGRSVERAGLLKDILLALIKWRTQLPGEDFLLAWQKALAFRGERVEVQGENIPRRSGVVEGLEGDDSLRLRSEAGQTFTMQAGEIHLRPLL